MFVSADCLTEAMPVARETADVVFPTPPLLLTSARMIDFIDYFVHQTPFTPSS